MNSFFKLWKVVSTDHKQAKQPVFFSFVYVKTIVIFDLFLFRKFTFFILLIPGTQYLGAWRMPSFLFWLCNVYKYL